MLRWGWDAGKYGNHRPDGGSDTVDVNVIDGAVTSPMFWSYLKMLGCLTDVLQDALSWSESCPCHWGLDPTHFPRTVVAQWKKCPLRGCRAPELACGTFMEVMQRLADKSAGALLTTLPRDISVVDRALLLREFQQGRSHLLFVLSLRVQHWRQLPWMIFGCGHLQEQPSQRFLA